MLLQDYVYSIRDSKPNRNFTLRSAIKGPKLKLKQALIFRSANTFYRVILDPILRKASRKCINGHKYTMCVQIETYKKNEVIFPL